MVVGALATAMALSPATAVAAPTPSVTDARSLLGAVQGGKLLGVPPLQDAVAGGRATLTSPEYWSNWVHEVLEQNRILLPLPIDVVKPDVVLPHAEIAASGTASHFPTRSLDLRQVTYQWAGHTKTVADYLNDSATDALIFLHNGAITSEYFANGWSDKDSHQAWSTTKSFVSTLVGIALDHHLIGSLDDPIDKYVHPLADTAWRGTSIRNLLEMRSGMQWDEDSENLATNDQVLEWIDLALDDYSNGQLGKTRNEFLRSLPRVEPQGQRFNYDSANTQVLAWLVETLYHKPFNEVLSANLWKPLGMEANADIMTDRTGAAIASEELFARPLDFVRLGEMMRNNGRTPDGRQIVSASWVHAATTGMKPAKDAGDTTMHGYGYQWWSGATPDGFQANGFQGNYITVAPRACVTGVRLAHTIQFNSGLDFAGQGNDEWHTVYRAILDRLGGCANS